MNSPIDGPEKYAPKWMRDSNRETTYENRRSEASAVNVAVGFCVSLVPVSHFYEFTGKRSPKDKWRFTKAGEDWFCIVGLWRAVEDNASPFTMLTCEPGPDVAPILPAKAESSGILEVEKVERALGKQAR